MQTLFLGFLLDFLLSTCRPSDYFKLNFLKVASGSPFAADLNLEGTVGSHVFRESIPLLPSRNDLKRRDRVRQDYIHEVIFVVRQRNMDGLTKILHDISNPESANFGQHLTREEVAKLTTNPLSRDTIISYLESHGATILSETYYGEYITANAPIEIWERLLNTEFFSFQRTQPNGHVSKIVRTERYWIPTELDSHVESVFKTVELPDRPQRDTATFLAETDGRRTMTPQKIRDMYNMTDHRGSADSTQAILGCKESYPNGADLASFKLSQNQSSQAKMSMGVHSNHSKCESVGNLCGVSNLGVQYMMSTSPESPTTCWQTDSDFTDWIIEVADAVNPPLVISIGFWSEERTLANSVHLAFTTEAIKLGAIGVTIVASSGDDGAVGSMVREGGTGRCGYVPTFPSSNPFVTSVGSTSVRLAKY